MALAGPLRGCPHVDYLGLKLNWNDYSKGQKERILSADKVLSPTIHYARQFAAMGIRTYPSAASYSLLGDKAAQTLLFQMAGLPMPKTRLFTGRGRAGRILEHFDYPLVAKVPAGSSRGLGVHLIRNDSELERYLASVSCAYIQEYLELDRDIRVVVMGGRPVFSYWRLSSPGDFRSNVARGGSVSLDQVPHEALELSSLTCRLTGIDHAGLDICWTGGRAVLLEANIHFGTEGFEKAGLSYRELLCSMIGKGEI